MTLPDGWYRVLDPMHPELVQIRLVARGELVGLLDRERLELLLEQNFIFEPVDIVSKAPDAVAVTKPLWKQLIPQSALEQQYDVLIRFGLDPKEVALRLARFAEARMYNAADKIIEQLRKEPQP